MDRRILGAIARWEILRFTKAKEIVLGALFFGVSFAGANLLGDLFEHLGSRPKDVAVVGGAAMGLDGKRELDRFRLFPETRSRVEWEAALRAEEVDVVLEITGPDTATLHVLGERSWQAELVGLLQAHRQGHRIQSAEIPPEVLAELAAPAQLDVILQDAGAERASPLTALLISSAMLMGLFLGFSYVFVAITGEKTQMVTESVLSAITPQQWVDGKILGLTVVVLIQLATAVVGFLLYQAVAFVFLDKSWSLPGGLGSPLTAVQLVLFATLGFGFWFTLFAMVAATISDPNSSSRSSLLLLPFGPLGLSLVGVDNPDAEWMQIVALVPGLSPTAMPLRILRGEPGAWEILVSLALLAGSIWLFRRAAGRIFGVSMLMTGKEPGFREVWRWIREP